MEADLTTAPEWARETWALDRRRYLLAHALTPVLLALGIWYLVWRTPTVAGTGILGYVFYAAEVFTFASVVLTTGLMLRIRVRDGAPSPPRGTLDVFVTVCGEPSAMVEKTLVAALAIDYPHKTYLLNDCFIAKQENDREIKQLAERLGVPCFTRRIGVRKKAGNLNNGLRRTHGDFVAVIDADHIAVPHFADHTLGYFEQEDLALVATPQRVVDGTIDPLNNQEPFFYRSLMLAKDASNATFSCGNAVIYRRSALESIGGFSEWNLVEDVHTSYRLHQQGWRTAYHPYAITTGTSPTTAAEYTKQRLRWTTDNFRTFLFQNPLWRRGLKIRQRLHYFHTTGFPIFNCLQILFLICPVLFLIWRVPVMRFVAMSGYGIHTLPYMCVLGLVMTLYAGRGAGVRNLGAAVAFAPTGVLGMLQALTGRRVPTGVTRKDREARFTPAAIPQYCLWLIALLGVVWAAVVRPPGAVGAGLWCAWSLYALTPFVAAVTPDKRRTRVVRRGTQLAVAGLAATLFVPAALQTNIRHAPVSTTDRRAQPASFEPDARR